MFLKNLQLVNFRNFSQVNLSFTQTTLLVGNNAQGKSNLLEAIYFLATTKSPRAELDLQLIKQGEQFTRVEGEIEGEVNKLEIAMQIHPEGVDQGRVSLEKRLKVNGVPRRTLDYIGNLVVVYFSPEDINLVSGPPALRRWHIDLTLAQVDRQYKKALTDYAAALTSRNRLLKRIREGLAKPSELDFWTEKLIEMGMVVADTRRRFFADLNTQVASLGKSSFSLGELRFIYQENVISQERIREYQPREIAAAASLIGPHRDDFTLMLNRHNLAHFGSRGEQRTAVLELKLAELEFIHKLQGIRPVLLLDDVFSELDLRHRDYVMSIVSGQQTILSAVEASQVPEKFLQSVKTVRVDKGRVDLL